MAFFSPDGSHDPLFVSNYVTLEVKDQIARLPGVGDLMVFGARDYAMRLWLDPDKLAVRGMTAGDVVNAVKEQNVQVAAGSSAGRRSRQDSALPIHGKCAGPAHRPDPIRRHRRQGGQRRPHHAAERCQPRRVRSRRLQHYQLLQWASRRRLGGLSATGH